MIHKIIIPENYTNSNILFFDEINIDSLKNPNLVLLFGPNGIGKTTLINAIAKTMSKQDYLAKKRKEILGETKDRVIPPKDMHNIDLKYILKNKEMDEFQWYANEIQRQIKKEGCVIESDNKPHKVLVWSNSENNFRYMNVGFNPYLLNARFDANSLSEGQSVIYSVFDLLDLLKPGEDMIHQEDGHTILLLDELDSGLSVDNIDIIMRKIKKILKQRDDLQIFMSFNNPRVLKHFSETVSLYDGQPIELLTVEDMLKEMKKNKKMFDKARRKRSGMPKVYS